MKKLMLILALVCYTGVFTSCREEKSGIEKAADDVEDAAEDISN